MLVVKYHRIKFTRFLKVEGKIHQIKKLGWNSPKIKKLDIKGVIKPIFFNKKISINISILSYNTKNKF